MANIVGKFNEWWKTAKPLYDGDSCLCALRAWQYQQTQIHQLEAEVKMLERAAILKAGDVVYGKVRDKPTPKHKGPHCNGSCEGAAYNIQIKILEAELKKGADLFMEQCNLNVMLIGNVKNAEGYLQDAASASQWEDYINDVPHLESEYTKEGENHE